MKQTDADLMLADAQVKLAMMLIGGILILAFATLGVAYFNDKFSSLATTIGTGILTLSGTAAGYFLGRQRPATLPDPTVTTVSTPSTSTVTTGDTNAKTDPPNPPAA
jgi:sugar phosphate permease